MEPIKCENIIIDTTIDDNSERNNKFVYIDEQLKLFLKKAMDVYFTIRENVITKTFNDEEYQLTEMDKKELSLLIAGILVNGNTKNIMQQHFNLDELLSFANISKETIYKLDEAAYVDFYDQHFLNLIDVILFDMKGFLKTNNITSEIIILYLKYSEFLNIVFCNNFYYHSFFKELELYLIEIKMMLSQLERIQQYKSFNDLQKIQKIPSEGIPTLRR